MATWLEIAANRIGGATENNLEILQELCPFDQGIAYMPVPRCDSCRFWEMSRHDSTRGECALTEWDDLDGHAHARSKAKAQAGGHECGSAALETVADFGCVQWEKKP